MRLPITFRPFNSGGKGGQHSNKTLNAMEVSVALPDGRVIKASSTRFKSQHDNRREALRDLKDKVKKALTPERERPDLSEVVRTYHEPRNIVTDHASGMTASYREVVEKEKVEQFEKLVEARRRAKLGE